MLVVGAGPAGLTAGIMLARYGISVLVVEKRSQISALPRAVAISTRTMEIVRSWGLEQAVRAGAADVETVCLGDSDARLGTGEYDLRSVTRRPPRRPASARRDRRGRRRTI